VKIGMVHANATEAEPAPALEHNRTFVSSLRVPEELNDDRKQMTEDR
jgi:hypothetical protein